MAAFNLQGKVVNVGDAVSILGIVKSIGGSLSTSAVAVQPPLAAATFTCQAQDLNVTEGVFTAGTSGVSYNNPFNTGDNCTVRGVVTAITGSGNTATLTVTLKGSQISVVGIPAGACNSDGF